MPARKSSGSHFQWVLVVMLGALVCWVWWNNLQPTSKGALSDSPGRLEVTPVLRATRPGSTNSSATLVVVRTPQPGLRETVGSAPRPVRNPYELQIALARQAISAGSLDGVMGSQTHAALRAYQRKEHLKITGEFDAPTKARLLLSGPSENNYTVTPEDISRLAPVGATWLAKSLQDRLDYESVLELVSEKSHAHPNLVRMLNPSVDWNNVTAGATIRLPEIEYPLAHTKAAFIQIRLSEKVLEAYDVNTNLLAHFPCSIARQVEKRPIGRLEVENIVFNPVYPFKPEIFPESEEARQLKRPLMIPQGPNNPVGTAWIGLNKPGYGIHGTPRPEDVGRTESHGCFRLANWNADYLGQLVQVGTPVLVQP